MKRIVNILNINQAVCRSREDNTIVSSLEDEKLSIAFIEAYLNGNIWGVYYQEDNLVYETKDGDIYFMSEDRVKLSDDEQLLFDTSDFDWHVNPQNWVYLIGTDSIEKLDLEENSADSDSDVCYYQGESGAMVTEKDSDGTEEPLKSGWYPCSGYNEYVDYYN